eukprot:scaffold19187_cov69-Attheya_sp.AAC.1
MGGGIPTQTGRLGAATLWSLTAMYHGIGRLPTLTIVEASRKDTVGAPDLGVTQGGVTSRGCQPVLVMLAWSEQRGVCLCRSSASTEC